MQKEIGKWFIDIAKYVATAVLISSFLGSFEEKNSVYVVGAAIIGICFIFGVFLIRKDDVKQKSKKNKK